MERRPDQIPLPYTDCRIGLVLFGLAQVGLGLLSFAFLALAEIGRHLTASQPGAITTGMMIHIQFIYAGFGIAMIVLGVGACLCRRWARALNLVVSVYGLLVGVVATVMIDFIVSRIPESAAWTPAMKTGMMVSGPIFTGLFTILPTLAMVLFYANRNVRATCEARDPKVRWTDLCPLPVLAVSLSLTFKALALVATACCYHGVMMFFGRLLSGPEGMFVSGCVAALWLYCAGELYHCRESAWWIILMTTATWVICNAIALPYADLARMNELMGLPHSQPQVWTGGTMSLWSLGYLVPWFGYLLFIKKYLGVQDHEASLPLPLDQ